MNHEYYLYDFMDPFINLDKPKLDKRLHLPFHVSNYLTMP